MNWKSTIALIVVLGGVASLIYYKQQVAEKIALAPPQLEKARGNSLDILKELSLSEWKKVQINQKGYAPVILKSAKSNNNKSSVFQLDGDWAVRTEVVEELISTLKNLSTRFHILPAEKGAEIEKRFSDSPIEIQIDSESKAGQTKLSFYKLNRNSNEDPFTAPIYLRVNEEPEYVRLSPEILTVLARPVEAYRMRQIFDRSTRLKVVESVSLEGTPPSIPIVSDEIQTIEVKTPDGGYRLDRVAPNPLPKPPFDKPSNDPIITPIQIAECWRVSNGISTERADPMKLQRVLEAIPELWVEKFIPNTDSLLAWGSICSLFESPMSYAIRTSSNIKLIQELETQESFYRNRKLNDNNQKSSTIRVTYKNGISRVLQIGDVTRVETKIENTGSPNPMIPPQPKITEIKYHYAKIGNNSLIFEVRGETLSDILLNRKELAKNPFTKIDEADLDKKTDPFEEIRDRSPLRIDPDTVETITIEQEFRTIVLKKKKRDPRGETVETKRDRWDIILPNKNLAESRKVEDLLNSITRIKSEKGEIIDQQKLQAIVGGVAFENIIDIARNNKFIKITIDHEKDSGLSRRIGYVKLNNNPQKSIVVNEDQKMIAYLVDNTEINKVAQSDREYRSLKLFDVSNDTRVVKIIVKGVTEYELCEIPDIKPVYKLLQPISRDADTKLTEKIFSDLLKAEAGKFIYDPLTESEKKHREEIAKIFSTLMKQVNPIVGLDIDFRMIIGNYENPLSSYGLVKPRATINIEFGGAQLYSPKKLLIGSEVSEGNEVYAKFQDSDSVFTLKRELVDPLFKGAADLVPLLIWEGNSDDITDIKISRLNGSEFSLTQQEGQWKLSSPREIRLSNSAVIPTAGALATIKAEKYESLTGDKIEEFGLDKPELVIEFTVKDKRNHQNQFNKTIRRNLKIGKVVPNGKGRYATTDENKGIFILSEETSQYLNKNVYDFINKQLIKTEVSNINKIIIDDKKSSVDIQRNGNDWRIENANFTIDKLIISNLTSALTNLEANTILEFESSESIKKYGLNEDSYSNRILINTENKEVYELRVGNELADGSGSRYIYLKGLPIIGVIDAKIVNQIYISVLDLVDRNLLNFEPTNLLEIKRTLGNEILIAESNGLGWDVIQPKKFTGDTPTFDDLTEKLSKLRADRVVEIDTKEPQKYGLDKPEIQIDIKILEKGKPITKTLKLGKYIDNNPQKGRYGQLEGSNSTVALSVSFSELVSMNSLQFRDKTIAKLISVDKIRLTRGEINYQLEKPSGKWVITEPIQADCEDELVREVIDSLAKLRAAMIVDDKVSDLKLYGLDKPDTWILYNGDKEVLSLLVGDPEIIEKDGMKVNGPRRYAKLSKGDLVFLIDEKTSKQLMSEVKNRSLWPSLDVSQVTSIQVDAKGGTGSFELQKAPKGWIDPKDNSLKINQDRVIQMLDTIANLKAEKYIRFNSDDTTLKLYGLNPPEKVLTVKTDKGQVRVLHIGRSDDQKRLYARTADPKSNEIVILGTNDSHQLNQSRSYFEKDPSDSPKSTKNH